MQYPGGKEHQPEVLKLLLNCDFLPTSSPARGTTNMRQLNLTREMLGVHELRFYMLYSLQGHFSTVSRSSKLLTVLNSGRPDLSHEVCLYLTITTSAFTKCHLLPPPLFLQRFPSDTIPVQPLRKGTYDKVYIFFPSWALWRQISLT